MNETMSGIKDVQMLNIASIVDVYAAAAFERKEYTGVEERNIDRCTYIEN